MKNIISGIIIALVILFCTISNSVKAELKSVYVFTPIDAIVKLEDVKTVYTNVYWECLECIEDTIDEYYKGGNDAAKIAYKQYLRAGIIAPVASGFIPVVFEKEYKGFWIFKIDR